MIIRLIIKNKNNSQLSIPEISNFRGLLSPLRTINYNLSEEEFNRVLPTLENLVKKDKIDLQINYEDTPDSKAVLKLIQQNSKVIFNKIMHPINSDRASNPISSKNDLIKIYGVIRAFLANISVQQIRNTVAAAGFDVTKISSKSEIKTGYGSRAEVLPTIDKLFGEMELTSMNIAVSILAEKLITNEQDLIELNTSLKKHGVNYNNGHFSYENSLSEPKPNSLSGDKMISSIDRKKLFVVHGRNEQARKEMFSFLRSIELNPIEWSEAISLTKNASPYIGEILDAAFQVAQAILVLITGDDLARLGTRFTEPNENHEKLLPQARPNVLFEAGMAIGRNAKRTIIVQLGKVRKFSDISGRHIINLNNTPETKLELVSRLTTAECDLNIKHKKDWINVGDFESCNVWPDNNGEVDFQELDDEKQWKSRYNLEDLKKQRELLLEFLGKPKSEFITLQGVGDTWDEDWRREKAKIIQEWIAQYRPYFPKTIQNALTGIGNLSGTMITVNGMKVSQSPAGYKASENNFNVIEAYEKEIELELKGK